MFDRGPAGRGRQGPHVLLPPPSIPCRTTGDLLLSYEVGSTISVIINRWTGDGTGPASCPDGGNGSFAESTASNSGRINAAAITNYLSPGVVGSSLARELFGEAQIDVSAVLASMGSDRLLLIHLGAGPHALL